MVSFQTQRNPLTIRTNFSRCPSNDLPTALQDTHHRFLHLLDLKGFSCELDRHLTIETASLSILTVLASGWRQFERVATPTQLDCKRYNDATMFGVHQLDTLRTKVQSDYRKLCIGKEPFVVLMTSSAGLISLPWSICQITYTKWWATFRNIWFLYRLATPLLVDEVYAQWLVGMQLAADASVDISQGDLHSARPVLSLTLHGYLTHQSLLSQPNVPSNAQYV
jgi:hypothetical protein